MRVRIAMRGYSKVGPTEVVEDVIAGVKLPWVELDGHRIHAGQGLISAEFNAAVDDLSVTNIVLTVSGPVELVYVDRLGLPLGRVDEIPAEEAPGLLRVLDHTSIVRTEEHS